MTGGSVSALRYDWTVGSKPADNSVPYPGMGFFNGGQSDGWQPVGLSTFGVFTVPGSDSSVLRLLDESEYYFYVRAWLSEKQFRIFRSNGVRVRARGPQLQRLPRVLDGNLVQNPDYWFNASVAAPTDVSVQPYVDLEYQASNTAVEATWEWLGAKGWDGMFTPSEKVRFTLCFIT